MLSKLSETWINIRSFVGTFIIGTIIGILIASFVGYRLWKKYQPVQPNKQDPIIVIQTNNKHQPITVNDKPNEGIISHSDWDFSGEFITFNTDSTGKAYAHTKVPKTRIPEYNSWVYTRNIVQANIYYAFNTGKLMPLYGASYYRKFDMFSAGGGVIVGNQFFGVSAGLQYMW